MTTSILALELIAPMIGGVVLTGAFGFFSGVMLTRKGQEEPEPQQDGRPEVNVADSPPQLTQRSTTDTLSDWSLNHRFHQLIQRRDIGASLSALLRWIAPNSSSGFAAIVGTKSETNFSTISEGLSTLSIDQLKVPLGLVDRLNLENPLFLDSEEESEVLLRWLDENDRKNVRQLSLTGLNDGNGIFAVLIASAPWPTEYPEFEQRELMKMTGEYVAHRWNQLLTLEQQSQELRLTRDMLELHSIIDMQTAEPVDTLNQFVIRLRDMVDADRVSVFFVARRKDEQLQPIVQCGHPYPSNRESEGHQHEQMLAKIAIESQTGQLGDSDDLPAFETNSPIGSSVTLPICINGRVLGALCTIALNDRGSLQKGRQLIEFAADILSRTLGRVFDEATIRRQARHDHLTDLINRRSLDAHLSEEVERIQRGDSSTCSLILADLDRFKSFNDRFGHQCGDHLLREAARVLSEQVSQLRAGEHSYVARYGGEEFAILLPNVGVAGAMRIAEGIRAAIEVETIRLGDTPMQVTLSLGVAVAPEQATSVDSLVAAADRALYQAKSDGRNCVRCADSFAIVDRALL